MLVLTQASLATVEEMFQFKKLGFELPAFAGYTPDQWGIKAHNRPWIDAVGRFEKGQRIIEVGGAYSTLPHFLGQKYGLEAWIGDDFGMSAAESVWSRWGDPRELPARYPSVKYVFERFGEYSPSFPNAYFDRIFSVSTLEHLPVKQRLDAFKDMHRCLKPGGIEIHSIDIHTMDPPLLITAAVLDFIPLVNHLVAAFTRYPLEMRTWFRTIEASGVKIEASVPNPFRLLHRKVLVDSPDVVYRFYAPNNTPKAYRPAASMLIIIEDR